MTTVTKIGDYGNCLSIYRKFHIVSIANLLQTWATLKLMIRRNIMGADNSQLSWVGDIDKIMCAAEEFAGKIAGRAKQGRTLDADLTQRLKQDFSFMRLGDFLTLKDYINQDLDRTAVQNHVKLPHLEVVEEKQNKLYLISPGGKKKWLIDQWGHTKKGNFCVVYPAFEKFREDLKKYQTDEHALDQYSIELQPVRSSIDGGS